MSTALEKARKLRDTSWDEIQRCTAQRTAGEVGLMAARKQFRMACDEVRGLEQDLLAYPELI